MTTQVRNAVVTGGASGMGLAIATEFSRLGASVAIWDLNGAAAESAVDAIASSGGTVKAYRVDVSNMSAVMEAAERSTAEIGEVHILVNCAGRSSFAPLASISEEIFDREVGVNLKGTFNCIKAIVPSMLRAKWGRIVNIASLAGQAGVPRLSVYSAAKAGVIGLTKAVAREFAGDGITCNSISPGAIDTPMLRSAFADGDLTADFSTQQAPMGRIGCVSEIVAACMYFVSDGAAFVTGQNIGVNGGAYI